jgi:hypothetical protein
MADITTTPVFATHEWLDVPDSLIPTLVERALVYRCDDHESPQYEVSGFDPNGDGTYSEDIETSNLDLIDQLTKEA